MEVMSPWKEKIIPFTLMPEWGWGAGCGREGMLCRGGSQGQLHWTTSGLRGHENAPEKASSTSQEKQAEKNPRHRSAVCKSEDKVLSSFEELLLPLEPIPTREVTGGHTGSCSHRGFSLPLFISLCSKQKEKMLLCIPMED